MLYFALIQHALVCWSICANQVRSGDFFSKPRPQEWPQDPKVLFLIYNSYHFLPLGAAKSLPQQAAKCVVLLFVKNNEAKNTGLFYTFTSNVCHNITIANKQTIQHMKQKKNGKSVKGQVFIHKGSVQMSVNIIQSGCLSGDGCGGVQCWSVC